MTVQDSQLVGYANQYDATNNSGRFGISRIYKSASLYSTSPDSIQQINGDRYAQSNVSASAYGVLIQNNVFSDGVAATPLQIAHGLRSLVGLYGPINPLTVTVTDSGIFLPSNWSGTATSVRNYLSRTANIASGANGTITDFYGFDAQSNAPTGVVITNTRMYRCTGVGGGTGVNSCFSTGERTGGTNNAAFHIDSNSATCGAGLVAGTAFDTCLYRGRAGAWTGPAGTDIYTDSGYICAGTGCSSVTSTNTGVYDAGVRVMSSVSCTGATCSLTNGALSVTVTGTTSATVSASITGGGSCGGSVSVLGSWSNMRVTLITGTGPGCSVPGDDVFQVVRGTACGSSGVPVCNISPADDVSPPLTWNGPSGSGTTRIARTPSYGSTLSVSTTYYYDIRCGCTTD